MKRLISIVISSMAICPALLAQDFDPKETEVWDPEPNIVTPGESDHQPPSDAVILFDGSSTDHWEHFDASAVKWKIEDGAMVVLAKSGGIRTKEKFGSIQLHIEWRTPAVVEGEGQGRGNSGVYLQERYEVQILDSYENRTYSNGQAGSIYKQSSPLVNAMRGPGQWQSYDIVYHAPTFASDSTYLEAPSVTVLHNGVLIQDHTTIKGATKYKGPPTVQRHGDGSIVLQDHNNPTAFRNIWLRRL